MAVADIPAELILNVRTSYDQYLWALPASGFYRWDKNLDYMYRIGAVPVEGQGIPPVPPPPPAKNPFTRGENIYLDSTFVKTVNGIKVDADGNVTLPAATRDQLDAGVQASLAKADAAIPRGQGAIVYDDINPDIRTAINNGAAAYAALPSKADLVGGVVPSSQIPAIAISDITVVASQAAMLGLTAQRGDVAKRTDLNGRAFMLGTEPASVLGNWIDLGATVNVQTINGQSGTVVLGKSDVGLGNADNTSDVNKPVSTAQTAAITAATADVRTGGRLGLTGKNASGTDLNALSDNGFYAGNNLTNSPDGSNGFFYVLVQQNTANDGYFMQTATRYARNTESGAMYRRFKEGGGVYTPWVLIADSGGAVDTGVRNVLGNMARISPRGLSISSVDLNTVVDAGFYSGSLLINAPDNIDGYFFVFVEGYTGDTQWVQQTATEFASKSGQASSGRRRWIRQRQGGTWTAWTIINDNNSAIDTTARAGAAAAVKTVNGTGPDANGNVVVSGGGGGGAVSSVAGKTGAVTLVPTDVGLPSGMDAAALVLGGRLGSASMKIDNYDLNGMYDTGFYSGFGLGNAPEGRSEYLYVVNHRHNTDGGAFTHQTATTLDSGTEAGATWQRGARGGVWSPWVKIADANGAVDAVARGNANTADMGHVQDVRYVAYGHSFGQVQSPIQNLTPAGVYPNRVLEMIKGDAASFANQTVNGARAAGVLTQVQNTWAQGNYGLVTLMCNQNDVGDRTAQATFKANVKAILDWLRGPAFPPTIVVVLDTTCTAAGYARYANPPTDAVVATYNQYLKDVVATYPVDGSIVIADPATGWNPNTMTGSDGQHPNDRGSAYIASAIRTALATTSYREGLNVGLVPPSTTFYDSFNRANSTTLGTAMYGTAWTMLGSSVYGTIGNRAYRSDAGAVQESAAVVDLGKANMDLSLKMDAITLKGAGPVWRASDINNMWAVDIFGTGVGNGKVYKKVGGTFTQVGSALTVEVKTSSSVRVVSSGNVHTVYVDGVQAWTGTDSFNATATKHGFRITDTSANANRINDVLIK